jgi:hypothetical protein
VANQMLEHLEAILELRRKRGLFIEERHAAGWKWGHSRTFLISVRSDPRLSTRRE